MQDAAQVCDDRWRRTIALKIEVSRKCRGRVAHTRTKLSRYFSLSRARNSERGSHLGYWEFPSGTAETAGQRRDPVARRHVLDVQSPRAPTARTKTRGDKQESARRTQPAEAAAVGDPQRRNTRAPRTCYSTTTRRPRSFPRAQPRRRDEPNQPRPVGAGDREKAPRSQRNANGTTHPWHPNPVRKWRFLARSGARARVRPSPENRTAWKEESGKCER